MANGLRSDNDFDSVYALDTWLRNGNYHYRDESEEVLRSVEFMLQDLETLGYVEGDCDDISTFGAATLTQMGIPARLFALQSEPDGGFDHVFSEARIGQYWIPVDPTVPPDSGYRIYGQTVEYVGFG